MGWGSSGTPPWVDAKNLDEEKQKKKTKHDVAKIRALEEENVLLKNRIKQLEDELEKIKNSLV